MCYVTLNGMMKTEKLLRNKGEDFVTVVLKTIWKEEPAYENYVENKTIEGVFRDRADAVKYVETSASEYDYDFQWVQWVNSEKKSYYYGYFENYVLAHGVRYTLHEIPLK